MIESDACYCDHQGERRQCTAAGKCLLADTEQSTRSLTLSEEHPHWRDYDEFMLLQSPPSPHWTARILAGVAALVIFLYLIYPAFAEPLYCKPLERFERSCVGVKMAVASLGKEKAVTIARKCGATDVEIAQAEDCLRKPFTPVEKQ